MCVFLVGLCTMFVQKARRVSWITTNCSYRWLLTTQSRCWGLNLSALREQPVLLTTEPSCQHPSVVFVCVIHWRLPYSLLSSWQNLKYSDFWYIKIKLSIRPVLELSVLLVYL